MNTFSHDGTDGTAHADGHAEAAPTAPLISVVRGDPTAEELAAVVTVLMSAAAPEPRPEPPPVSAWSAYARVARPPIHPGPGAWRSSARRF